MTTVGVLGIGRMGGAMARALRAAGFDLVLWNRTPDAARHLAHELGATTADRPADVAATVDASVTMLANDDAVDAVYGGPDGLAAGARPDTVLIDSSTVSPAALRRHEAAIRGRGAGVVDAPVSGSITLAETGKLTLMVGGDAVDVERAAPILDALSATRFHLGPLGTGHAMKLATNTAIFGHNQAIAEGLVLAEAAGIDRAAAYDVLAASVVGSAYVGYKRAAFLEPEATPVAFALDLAAKDLRLIGGLAGDLGLELPGATTDLAVIEAAAAAHGGDRDFSTVAGYLSERRHR